MLIEFTDEKARVAAGISDGYHKDVTLVTSDNSTPQDKNLQAPSEKHLEDWIVANPQDFATGFEVTFPLVEKIVARQLRLPSGIPDLIALNDDQLIVIELKRNLIDEAVLGQTLRYMADLKRIWIHAWNYGLMRDGSEKYTYCLSQRQSLISGHWGEIGALIVGHRIQKQSVVDAADGANISIVTYDYDGSDYKFKDRWPSLEPERTEIFKEFSYGGVGEAMRLIMHRRTDTENERRGKPFDFNTTSEAK